MLPDMEQAIRLLDDQSTRSETIGRGGGDDEEALTIQALQTRRSRWRTTGSKTLSVLRHLLPSYLHAQQRAVGELHPTAYLDALRGYASVMVFIYHTFGLPNIWWLRLPIIRVVFDSGAGMVAIFFVISGYVLSYRMLKMIRTRQAARLHDSLASSIFRRFIRLYGSTGVATFIAAIMVTLRWYIPYGMTPRDTFFAQMWDWFLDFAASSNPFANIDGWIHEGVFHTHYLDQMWTIPIEYRGSIVLFVFSTASSKLSTTARWVFLWIVVLLSYYWRAVYVAEFLLGMFVADLSLSRHPERLGPPPSLLPRLVPLPVPGFVPVPSTESEAAAATEGDIETEPETESQIDEKSQTLLAVRWRRSPAATAAAAIASRVGWVMLLLLSLVLLGQPDRQHTPDLGATNGDFPWPYLIRLIPSYYGDAAYTFWLGIGAFLLVLSLDSCRMLQLPFEWRFSQYLGDLSFGIYAMHWPIYYGFYRTVVEPWRVVHLGNSHLARIPGALLDAILVLWAADYFTRLDRLVVRSARWLQNKTFLKWE